MKAWVVLPVLALALAAGLSFAPRPAEREIASVRTLAVETHLVVRVAVAEQQTDVMSDACVFSAEAMAAGVAAQCGASAVVPAVVHLDHPGDKALVWPGDFIAIVTTAASDTWDATLCFVDSIFGYAEEKTGLNI